MAGAVWETVEKFSLRNRVCVCLSGNRFMDITLLRSLHLLWTTRRTTTRWLKHFQGSVASLVSRSIVNMHVCDACHTRFTWQLSRSTYLLSYWIFAADVTIQLLECISALRSAKRQRRIHGLRRIKIPPQIHSRPQLKTLPLRLKFQTLQTNPASRRAWLDWSSSRYFSHSITAGLR